jgi:hypothetical protein
VLILVLLEHVISVPRTPGAEVELPEPEPVGAGA